MKHTSLHGWNYMKTDVHGIIMQNIDTVSVFGDLTIAANIKYN